VKPRHDTDATIARRSAAVIGTLVAGSIGLTAGVTLALLAVASMLWVP